MTEPKANIIVFRYFPEIVLYSISDTIIWFFPVGYSRHITVVANEIIYPLIFIIYKLWVLFTETFIPVASYVFFM